MHNMRAFPDLFLFLLEPRLIGAAIPPLALRLIRIESRTARRWCRPAMPAIIQ